LQAALEVSRRHVYCEVREQDAMTSPGLVREYLSLHLSGLQHEVFAALFLDNRHRVLEFQTLSTGTIDSAAVYPREVVKRCLASNAAAVIFLRITTLKRNCFFPHCCAAYLPVFKTYIRNYVSI